jgi:ABC-type long-subunit fatty acid transport system fused permease/ATPase subunit
LEDLANPPKELIKEKDKASKTSAVTAMLIFAAVRKGYIHLY